MRRGLAIWAPSSSRPPLIRAFYLPSYNIDTLLGTGVATRLTAMRALGTTHAILTVHVRATGDTVFRDSISENPLHLPDWFALVRSKGMEPALAIILFRGQFGWAGFWNPQSPDIALANYWTTIRPYIQQAQAANLQFVILCDEWSTLYAKSSSIQAFSNLFAMARTEYGGKLALNVSNTEEASIRSEIPVLTDFVGVNAYVPIATVDHPTVEQMVHNLIGRSDIAVVRELVDGWRATWGDNSVAGYTSYLAHLAKMWSRPILLTTGYKSTTGAARDPSGQPETATDYVIQTDCWNAFFTSMPSVGQSVMGYACWRWWPSSLDDDGDTGFSVQDKPAASVISDFF